MQSSADLSIDTGTTVTHSFLHSTIQEFLAAYHLSNESDEFQKFFIEINNGDAQLDLLIKSLVGLSFKAVMNLDMFLKTV